MVFAYQRPAISCTISHSSAVFFCQVFCQAPIDVTLRERLDIPPAVAQREPHDCQTGSQFYAHRPHVQGHAPVRFPQSGPMASFDSDASVASRLDSRRSNHRKKQWGRISVLRRLQKKKASGNMQLAKLCLPGPPSGNLDLSSGFRHAIWVGR